ncbi:segregation and condensation protein A [Legionella spiritensis]|uniref:segregation and condensation protein A n=1 Tax=Legionella spiritensis TaxID=452 RepID=UPI000F7124C9|nr:segregation/condensation protein A [Legionella spiritensis]VEG90032.1 segregation and condensation protein A [Legionella spiritensis]
MKQETAGERPMVLAMVDGREITEIPADLFIPPDALEILLETFSGPLDLLLYLIKRQNIDILDIPIAHITRQYMQYIQWMEEQRLELAADYLVMAAMLAEIKSRLLLPVIHNEEDGIEDDPRLALVRKLQAYEEIKKASLQLDDLPRRNRDFFPVHVHAAAIEPQIIFPDVLLEWLPEMMRELITRQSHQSHHAITREQLSVRDRMTVVLERLRHEKIILFHQILIPGEGRTGLTVSILAILELAKESLLLIQQTALFAPIHIMAVDYE